MKAQDIVMDGATQDFIVGENGDFLTADSVLGQLYFRINAIKFTTFWDPFSGSLIHQENNKADLQKINKIIANSIQQDVITPLVKLGYIVSTYTLTLVNMNTNKLNYYLETTDLQGNIITYPFSVG